MCNYYTAIDLLNLRFDCDLFSRFLNLFVRLLILINWSNVMINYEIIIISCGCRSGSNHNVNDIIRNLII